jgi:hypothetical protein
MIATLYTIVDEQFAFMSLSQWNTTIPADQVVPALKFRLNFGLSFVWTFFFSFFLNRGVVLQHNPAGSNDRLNEPGQRQNDQRLFNSQNNAAGGYGTNTFNKPMSYYEGSWLTVEWTNQHACSNSNTDCAIIIQYMCVSGDAGAERADSRRFDDRRDHDRELRRGRRETPRSTSTACTSRSTTFAAARRATATRASSGRQEPAGQRAVHAPEQRRHALRVRVPGGARLLSVLAPVALEGRRRADQRQLALRLVPRELAERDGQGSLRAQEPERLARGQGQGVEVQQRDRLLEGRRLSVARRRHAPLRSRRPTASRRRGRATTTSATASPTAGLAGHMNHYNFTLPTTEPCLKEDNCKCVLRLRYNTRRPTTPATARTTATASSSTPSSTATARCAHQAEPDDRGQRQAPLARAQHQPGGAHVPGPLAHVRAAPPPAAHHCGAAHRQPQRARQARQHRPDVPGGRVRLCADVPHRAPVGLRAHPVDRL